MKRENKTKIKKQKNYKLFIYFEFGVCYCPADVNLGSSC